MKRYRNVAGASNLESDGGSVTFGGLGELHSPPLKDVADLRFLAIHRKYHLCRCHRELSILGDPYAK
jgi:hypothetical protein